MINPQRCDEQRTIEAKIARLRQRIKELQRIDSAVAGVLLGILDLLADEL